MNSADPTPPRDRENALRADVERLDGTGTRVIVVVGPTASGKTVLAERLASALDGEVISADSMQVYRGMNIGTAKPVPEERLVPYHCLDLVQPGEAFSAALYQSCARAAIAQIAARGRVPVLAGGTGLYVRAAIDEWEFPRGESGSPERDRIEALAAEIGAEGLHERLREIDPSSAALIHPHNVRRVVRALEMAAGGTSYAEQAAGFRERRSVYDAVFIGLAMERAELYRRIDARVDAMIAEGLLEEVRGLLEAGYRDALTATQAIGYKEFVPVVERGADLAEAIEDVKRATRRYAKRQLTWFRADPRIQWIELDTRSAEDVTAEALRLVESGESAGNSRSRTDGG